ncbi:hypothetical protein [Dongia deserti]|uniref:hypothetical protein n=1 Tax=Dongia deserti TaxID=2268030 RepID=UPI0013C4F6E5|nr:hypothetical protein [Dongia deserti]
MHALIVAGPSGAGKTSFVREFRAGRVPAHIRRHLPQGAETWPQFCCSRHEEWEAFVVETEAAGGIPGFILHYDITYKWYALKHQLWEDPLWPMLHRCEAATLVEIRPTQRRLLDQWILGRLGVPRWKLHARKLLAPLAKCLLQAVGYLRIAKHPRIPDRTRYPKPIRFLKHVDRALRSYRQYQTGAIDFYRRRGNIEQMLRSWDAVAEAKMATLPVTRVDLSPDAMTVIGKTFGWRLEGARTNARVPA